MTHRERAVKALTLQIPDYVPTFELEFQLEEEFFGKAFLREEDLVGKTEAEQEKMLWENAEYHAFVYERLGYSIIPIHYLSWDNIGKTASMLRKIVGNQYLLACHGDGTFKIPNGDEMLDFVYWLSDEPDDAKAVAAKNALEAIEKNKRLIEQGIDCFLLCRDYCYNSGPFLSPAMFREFVQPYLYDIVAQTKSAGAYVIKHTDGNIMPIIDQLVECKPHALHSLDPMAGVDIREVKRLVGNQVALCGNVHCAALQSGTVQDVTESAEYCLKYAKPGGGYIFCTSNIPFKGMPAERYRLVLDIWKKHRDYTTEK